MQANETGGYWLDQKHPEFDQIQYYLKTCLQDRGVTQNLEVWKIENPEANYKYERKTANMLKVACWAHANTIEGSSLEDICTKGVRFDRTSKGGMEFKTGVIEFSSELALYTSYCLVYFEVAVGRSYVFDGDAGSKKIPAGYDSFYIPPTPLDRNNDGQFDLQEYQSAAQFDNRDPTHYRHRYFVADPTQVSAKYVVRFDLGKKVSGGAIGTAHPRTIDPASQEDDDVSLFDPITLTTVSRKALQQSVGMAGSGSSTILGQHQSGPSSAIPIQQAFNQAMEDYYVKDKDPVMLSKKDWTGRQLSILEEKVREVNLNYAEISEAIAEAAASAMARLQTITRNKLETCLSMEIELRREAEQLAWLDKHIEAQMRDAQAAAVNTTLPKSEQQRRKLDFIKSWKYYTIFRNSVSRAKPTELQALSSLHGDTKIHSDIQIFADPFYSGGGSAMGASNGSSNNGNGAVMESHFSMQPYAIPAQPTEILVSASLQSLVDQEMEAIQRAVRAAVEGEGPPLPRTVARPLVGGERVSLPLHELLDSIPEEPIGFGDAYDGYGNPSGPVGFQPVSMQMLAPLPEDGEFREGMGLPGSNASKEAAFARSMLGNTGGSPLPGQYRGATPPPLPDQHDPYGVSPQTLPSISPVPAGMASPAPIYQRTSMVALFPSAVSVDGSQSPTPASAPVPPSRNASIASAAAAAAPRRASAGMAAESLSVISRDSRASRDAVPTNMNLKHQGKVIYMDKQQLLQFASSKEQHSLREISARKRKQMQSKNALPQNKADLASLHNSAVLEPGEVEQLFFSLPFFSRPPTLKLIYSTQQHYRSLEELLSKTFKHRGPSLLLIKSGEFSFGAYLTHQLAATCAWTGSPSCFLFSNTLSLKIPYHARTAAQVVGTSMGVPGMGGTVSASSPLAYFVQPDAIFIGNGDLSIDADLMSGSSELENFYGCNIVPRSPEALCLLAGTPVFNIDILEVWAIST